jgi:hypothetical protein
MQQLKEKERQVSFRRLLRSSLRLNIIPPAHEKIVKIVGAPFCPARF